jgi:hypothetical protein
MKAALLAVLGLVLAACGQDAPAPVDTPTQTQPQPTPTPIRDLATIDMPSLIYWQSRAGMVVNGLRRMHFWRAATLCRGFRGTRASGSRS